MYANVLSKDNSLCQDYIDLMARKPRISQLNGEIGLCLISLMPVRQLQASLTLKIVNQQSDPSLGGL